MTYRTYSAFHPVTDGIKVQIDQIIAENLAEDWSNFDDVMAAVLAHCKFYVRWAHANHALVMERADGKMTYISWPPNTRKAVA